MPKGFDLFPFKKERGVFPEFLLMMVVLQELARNFKTAMNKTKAKTLLSKICTLGVNSSKSIKVKLSELKNYF